MAREAFFDTITICECDMGNDGTTDDSKLVKIEMLESAPQFSFLDFEEKKRLVQYMVYGEYLPGDPLIREEETLNCVHFIFEGQVEVVKTSAEGDRVSIAKLGRGEIVGEGALLPSDFQSTVLIRAEKPTKALSLPKKDFKNLMINSPQTAFNILFDILRLTRRRLNEVSNKLADHISEHK